MSPTSPGPILPTAADPGLETWLARRSRQLLWILLAVGLVLRVAAFAQLSDTPAERLNTFEDSDMAYFSAWSQQLGRGEGLVTGGRMGHPVHTWHRRVGAEYLSVHPEAMGGIAWNELDERGQLNEVAKLWNAWYGGRQFHQEPLYPYLMALGYGLFGHHTEVVQILQMLVGLITIALVFQVGRIYFGEVAGLFAAALVTCYGPLLHYEYFLLRASLISLAGLLLVYTGERVRAHSTWRRWLGYGVLCGLAMALKASFGLFALLMALYATWPDRQDRRLVARRLGLWALGTSLVLLPVLVRNLAVGAPALSLTSVGPVTFAVSNHADYIANSNWTVDAPAVARIMGQSGGGMLPTVMATLQTHDDPWSWPVLLWEKFWQIWHWLEVPNNTNVYFTARISPVLGAMPVTFTVLAALGLVGLAAGLRTRRRAVPLLLLIAASVVQMVGFYVLSRFRVPMAVALAPLSAYGLVSLLRWLRQGQLLHLGAGVLAAGGFALFLERAPSPDRPAIFAGDYQLAHTRYYLPEWQDAAGRGDWVRAADVLRRAIAIRPDDLDGIGLQSRRVTQDQARAVAVYALTYDRYATTLENLGDTVEARRIRARAHVLDTIARSVVRPGR